MSRRCVHHRCVRMGVLTLLLWGILLPVSIALAQVPPVAIPAASFGPICAATGLCSNSPASGILSLVGFLLNIAVPAARIIFIGLSVIYVAWYALTMIVGGYDETVITEQRKAFTYAALGMGIVGVSSLIVDTFAPNIAGAALINPTPFIIAVERIVDFITIVTGTFLVFVISIAGARIIALQGNESEVDKQKKNFFNGLLGVVILLTARIVVEAVMPTTGVASDLIPEIAGIAKFLLEIVAGLAVFALIVAGVLLIVSVNNDNLKQRARRILFSTLIILLIVIFSHTIVATFIPPSVPPSTL